MNAQIYDEASEWLIELETEETDANTRERFATWLDNSPEHVRAYLEVLSLWDDAADVDRQSALDVDALMELARSESNLFSLEVSPARRAEISVTPRGPWSRTSRNPGTSRWLAIAASIAVLGVGAGAAWIWASQLRGVYSTDTGEQRTLALSDGSTVELNASTRIRERFTETERAVELLQGQALFRVAKNAARPFVVKSDTATVRAVGTQFDVHRRATGTTVTVLEGRVVVAQILKGDVTPTISIQDKRSDAASSVPSAKPGIYLGAGEQLNLNDGPGTAHPQRADLDTATAWTQQRLVFESTKLSDAAEEFNRFNSRKLTIDSQELDDFRVSGTFEALDPHSLDRFIRFLRDQPGLSIVESTHRVTVTKNR